MKDQVKIAGIWELNWNVPITESWMWTFVLREFGITDWHMTPVSGIRHNESHTGLDLIEHDRCDDMVAEVSKDETYTRVFVDETGAIPLNEFEHPEKAIYFFGCAGRAPTDHKDSTDLVVSIPTQENHGVLWPHQCLLTILYDRYIKSLENK